MTRPIEPEIGHHASYRGWECGYDIDAALWTGEGWRAYRGGADLDAPTVTARLFTDLLIEIDDAEDEA
jgi:hypothetical protein